jgi:integrase
MRKGEQFGLTWAGVDLDRSQLTLRKTKNRKTRYVQLNRTALAAFRAIERSETNGYVFQATRYDARLQDPKKWFENAIEEARIEDFRWHDLRHTFISRLVMAGVPLAIVQKLAGHGDPKMTSRYAHLAPKVTQDAVNTLGAAIAVDPAEAAAIQSLDHSAVS